mmetsp:Transcript_48082/g.57986  ORF Transcript_48082/g.57986 Transcript_48082/m.57986 type:complete len:250 (+) Transcript_48082:119-868(+)
MLSRNAMLLLGMVAGVLSFKPSTPRRTNPSIQTKLTDCARSNSSRRDLLRLTGTLAFGTFLPSPSSAIDVSGLRVEGQPPPLLSPPITPSSTKNIIELAGVSYTPAAMILQMAEQTASMEGVMKASASEMDASKTKTQRIDAGSKGLGPGVIQRTDLTKSVDIMVKNSKLGTIAPNAAVTLTGIPRVLAASGGDMSKEEYLAVGRFYEAAREDLKRAFEGLSENEQTEGRSIVRRLRARDEERMQQMLK